MTAAAGGGAVACGAGDVGGLLGTGADVDAGGAAGACAGITGFDGSCSLFAGVPLETAAGAAPTAVSPARGCAGTAGTGARSIGSATATGTAATGAGGTTEAPGAGSTRFTTGLCTVTTGTDASGTAANGAATGPGAAGRIGTGVAGVASCSVFATIGVTPDVAMVGCTTLARSLRAPASARGVTLSERAATGWDPVIAATGTTVTASRFTRLVTVVTFVTLLMVVTLVTLPTLTAFT